MQSGGWICFHTYLAGRVLIGAVEAKVWFAVHTRLVQLPFQATTLEFPPNETQLELGIVGFETFFCLRSVVSNNRAQ